MGFQRTMFLPTQGGRDATGKAFILSTVGIYFHLLYGLKNLGGGEKARNQICGPRRMGCRCSRVLREFEALFWGRVARSRPT